MHRANIGVGSRYKAFDRFEGKIGLDNVQIRVSSRRKTNRYVFGTPGRLWQQSFGRNASLCAAVFCRFILSREARGRERKKKERGVIQQTIGREPGPVSVERFCLRATCGQAAGDSNVTCKPARVCARAFARVHCTHVSCLRPRALRFTMVDH